MTPHERFFGYQRRSTHGSSLPSWLMSSGPVLLRRFVRSSKTDPLVDQVELVDSNLTYANIRYADGRESTVSVRDLAPCPPELSNTTPSLSDSSDVNNVNPDNVQEPISPDPDISPNTKQNLTLEPQPPVRSDDLCQATERRSSRIPKPPSRYGWDYFFLILSLYFLGGKNVMK